jgi:hypothetical protein
MIEEQKPGEGLDLEAAAAKVKRASDELSRICNETWAGGKPWHWEIPANPARDSDLLLGGAIEVANAAIVEVRRLRDTISRYQDAFARPAPTPEAQPPARFRVSIGDQHAEIQVSQHAPPEYHQGMIETAIAEVLRRATPVRSPVLDISIKAGKISGIAEGTASILKTDRDAAEYIPTAITNLKEIIALARSLYGFNPKDTGKR